MAKTDGKDMVNQVATAKDMKPATDFQDALTKELSKSFKAMQSIVPKHVTPERMARVCLNAVSRNPKLFQCTPASIVGAIMNCATLGLEPNLIGHAYLVPFWNNKTNQMEAQFQVGYKGAIELFRRTGEVANITAHEVCKNDVFEVTMGTEEKIVHKPAPWGTDRGEVVGYYSTYRLKDGGYGFCVMSKKEVEKHRDVYTKSRNKQGKIFGPWVDNFDEMAKKTCILKMAKYMPISVEKQENQQIIEGINRDGGVIIVKESNLGIGDAFMDAQYAVVNDDDEYEATPPMPPNAKDGDAGATSVLDFEQAMTEQ